MRTIEYASRFKRDYRRIRAGALGDRIKQELEVVLDLLIHDRELPRRYADHRLTGEWQDHRDCHVRPDLILIYRKIGPDGLLLARLGSHSELGF